MPAEVTGDAGAEGCSEGKARSLPAVRGSGQGPAMVAHGQSGWAMLSCLGCGPVPLPCGSALVPPAEAGTWGQDQIQGRATLQSHVLDKCPGAARHCKDPLRPRHCCAGVQQALGQSPLSTRRLPACFGCSWHFRTLSVFCADVRATMGLRGGLDPGRLAGLGTPATCNPNTPSSALSTVT